MKKLFILILAMAMFTGCATTKLTTNIGVLIGDSFQKSAEKGTISAEQSIKAWPYISGLVKGLLASNYEFDLTKKTTDIISGLDDLAKKETLTNEEKGFVIGSFVRLEQIALADGWDRYGVSIYNLVKKTIGG